MAGLVLQDAPRPVRIATLKGQRNEPVLGTHLYSPRQSGFTRCFHPASPCPDRRVVVTASSAECWLASQKKTRLLCRRKKRRTKVASSRPPKRKNQSNQKNSLQESMTACFVQRQQKNASDLRKTRGTRMQNNIVKRPLKSETTPKLIQTRTSRC